MKMLRTQQLTLQLPQKTLCHELNWAVHAGEVWGILGANGSGKSSLLHALAGLNPLSHQQVFLFEKKMADVSAKWIAQRLGILLQDTQLIFPQTVFEYCLAGRYPHLSHFSWENADDKQIAWQALTIMELENKAQQTIFTLSGGERRRLAIATLLTQHTPIYLLDEPTNHLDLRHQLNVLTHYRQLAHEQRNAVVMALHDINHAQTFCDHILMLFADGRTLQGTVEEVLTEENVSALYQQRLSTGVIGRKKVWIYLEKEND